MTHQVVTVFPAELWLEIFVNLFDDLVDEWQFETFRNCSLVCKEFHNLLNWKIVQGEVSRPNLWKLLAFKHSIPIPTDEIFLDMRKIFCQFIIPTELSMENTHFRSYDVDGFSGYNYVSSGSVKYFIKLKFGVGLLKKMINIDESILELFKDFMHRIVGKSEKDSPHPEYGLYKYSEQVINGNLPFDKYEYLSKLDMESYYPPFYANNKFEDTKKDIDRNIFESLKRFIGDKDNKAVEEECEEKITEIQVMREYITKNCPIVVDFKDIYIGIIFSFAQVFITREGKCIFFEFSADD